MIDKTTMRRIRAACGHALAGLLLLAVAAVPVLPAPARAADLIGNINVFTIYHGEYANTVVDVGKRKAQKFTTGSTSAGYTLESVVAYIQALPNFPEDNPGQPRLKIYSSTTAAADADKRPDTLLYTLTTPSTLSVEPTYGTFSTEALNTFTAPANATLEADTDYFIVFENTGTVEGDFDLGQYSDYVLPYVFGGNEDPGGASGWSLADDYCEGSTTAWTDCVSASKPLRLQS